jgi:hypothetical protein
MREWRLKGKPTSLNMGARGEVIVLEGQAELYNGDSRRSTVSGWGLRGSGSPRQFNNGRKRGGSDHR